MEAIAEARTRPARKQHDPETGPRQEHAYDSDNYNVWYGKSARGRERGRPPQKIAATRCDAVLDSGRTRGDAARQTTHCLHFARGCCVSGLDCPFLHRLPTAVDDARASPMHDCFGREKHPDEREDNGGVGSYIRNVRTLFVYYGGAGEWSRDRVIALLERQFSEWGPVEDVYAVPVKCIGFVRFKFRSSAEFAKEAMMGQRLTKTMTEPLTVRWANDDPNPTAVRRVKREREETAADAIVRAEARAPPEQRAAMAHLRFLANARRGRAETSGDDDGDGDEAPNPLAYPDTDAQYPEEGEGGVVADARRVATDAVDGADAHAGEARASKRTRPCRREAREMELSARRQTRGQRRQLRLPRRSRRASARRNWRGSTPPSGSRRARPETSTTPRRMTSTSSTRTITRRSRWRRWGMRGVEDGRGAGGGNERACVVEGTCERDCA